MEILVVDYGMNEDKVVLGFINDYGEVEYAIYHRGNRGTLEVKDETNLASIGAILANEAGMVEYRYHTLKEVE